MAFVYRSDLTRPLNSGEVDGNFAYVEDLTQAAQSTTSTFDTVANGLAATSDGQLFSVPTGTGGIDVYRNDAGSATLLGNLADTYRDRANHTGTQPLSTISDAGTMAGYDYQNIPALNILGDSGRFDGGVGGWNRYTAGPYANSFFNSYNGSSFSEAGKFIFDNTDFGGTAGTMTATTVDLVNAMGRTGGDARYGVEFFLSQIDCGTGTTAPSRIFQSETLYLMTTNGSSAIFTSNGYATFVAWVRAVGGNIGVQNKGEIYVNGESMAGDAVITPADGWTHIRHVQRIIRGFDNAFPYIFGASGRSLQVACPGVFTGLADVGMHTSPLVGIGAGGI